MADLDNFGLAVNAEQQSLSRRGTVEVKDQSREQQQQRTKLLILANELDAGTVKHRSQVHTLTLDRLRSLAVMELRNKAAQRRPAKRLPGPHVDNWLQWACCLQEGRDRASLVELRANFPALECFASRMEQSYWIPGKRAHIEPATLNWTAEPETRESDYTQESKLYPSGLSFTSAVPFGWLPQSIVRDTSHTGDQEYGYESDQPKAQSETPYSAKQVAVRPPDTEEPPVAASSFAERSNDDPDGQSSDVALEKLKAIVEQRKADREYRMPRTVLRRHRTVLACVATVAILVLSVALWHAAKVGARKLRTIFIAARAQATGVVADSEIQKELDLSFADVKDRSLRATVENGAVTLSGYTSSPWESMHAESVAARIDGVKVVKNEIQVEVPPVPDPEAQTNATRKSTK